MDPHMFDNVGKALGCALIVAACVGAALFWGASALFSHISLVVH